MRLDPSTTAFLIVDMQNDFLDDAGYFGMQGLPVDQLQRAVQPTLALRDALPATARTVLTMQVYEPDGSDDLGRMHQLRPAALARSTTGAPVRRGSWGADIIPALAPRASDVVVGKRRFDAFFNTELDTLLRCWGIRTVILAGVVAEVCVESTARAAYMRDYDVILARDCIGAWSGGDLDRCLHTLGRYFGLCLSNADILAATYGTPPRL